jgi:ribonuclease HI
MCSNSGGRKPEIILIDRPPVPTKKRRLKVVVTNPIVNFSIYTDGGVKFKNRIGAWAYFIKGKYRGKNVSWMSNYGSRYMRRIETNSMEILAVIEAFHDLVYAEKKTMKFRIGEVTIYTDSEILTRSSFFIDTYEENGWTLLGSDRQMDSNTKGMWRSLKRILDNYNITFVKVKGHSDNKNNIRVDSLCRDAYDEFEEKWKRGDFKKATSTWEYRTKRKSDWFFDK